MGMGPFFCPHPYSTFRRLFVHFVLVVWCPVLGILSFASSPFVWFPSIRFGFVAFDLVSYDLVYHTRSSR